MSIPLTRLTAPVQFDALLMKLQRAMRGAADNDVASALIALLFHRMTLLDPEDREGARGALAALLKADAQRTENLTLTEGPRRTRLLRVTH